MNATDEVLNSENSRVFKNSNATLPKSSSSASRWNVGAMTWPLNCARRRSLEPFITTSNTSANSPSSVEQNVTDSFLDAPTSSDPLSGENVNMGPKGVFGGTMVKSQMMSPLLMISIS